MSLPHTNKILPRVLSKTAPDANSLCVQLFIPDDLTFFAGHFPSIAIVPGVVQVDWAISCAGLELAEVEKLTIKKLKFQRPMLPGISLKLNLYFAAQPSALRFSFHGDDVEYSSGEIHFG